MTRVTASNNIVKRRKKRRRKAVAQGSDSVGRFVGDAWSLAKRTALGLNEIRKLINIETKVIDTTLSPTSIDNSGVIVSLTSVGQGINYTERIGDSIKLQRIVIRSKLLMNTTSTGTVVRIILFRDLMQAGSAPSFTNLLGGSGTLNPVNYLLKDRFAILADELLFLSQNGQDGAVSEIDLPHEGHVKYIGTSSSSASNGFGSVYIAAVSDEATNLPQLSFHCRVTFTDD